ncbi:MAG: DUF2284 domain-containing protein [Desulforhopalus sp.]
MRPDIERLIDKALFAGASAAAIIAPQSIVVDPQLAMLCSEPRCENYGLSKSCPPYVAGPEYFRKLIEQSAHCLALRLDIPAEILFSAERVEVMHLLHDIVATLEQQARQWGWTNSQGFAGGSCKKIFCGSHRDCRVVDGNGTCRHPASSRPSMSGYGVNVAKMMESAGWKHNKIARPSTSGQSSMSWVAGLVMIG